MEKLKAPFWWFGGKSLVASKVWQHLGDPDVYIEPFAGSLAVLLARPNPRGLETVNDIDGHVVNVWRAIAQDPVRVAELADWPSMEVDLVARNEWLVERREKLVALLKHDPEYYDVRAAAWWLWGQACWIAGGFVSGEPADWREAVPAGERKKLPKLDGGQGVEPMLRRGRGELLDRLLALSSRMRNVRIICGDWARFQSKSATTANGTTAVFLDPPYDGCSSGLYAGDRDGLSSEVRKWAIKHGEDPRFRIVLCGHTGEHQMPESWAEHSWSRAGGFSNHSDGPGKEGRHKERMWTSPHCLDSGHAT